MSFIKTMLFHDLDLYAKRIGIYYKYKEKISSKFGMILTFIYIILTLSLFCYYMIITIARKKVTFYDSSMYTMQTPSIKLTNSELYFSFGVEDPITLIPFIDETIYYPKVTYQILDRTKTDNNMRIINLDVEKCDLEKFGKEYQDLIKSQNLKNSYCIKNIDLTLSGSFIYDEMSYIQILIYPCKNSTYNNNHCKPQEIIDKYLEENYVNIVIKDLGFTPYNYSIPVSPSLKNLYTSIGKSFFKEYSIFYRVIEIQTDQGLLFERIKNEKYIQFYNEGNNIHLFNKNQINKDETFRDDVICRIEIKLSDNIRVYKRNYMKISEVFSTIGGYLQLFNTVFSLLSILYKNLNLEKTLVNGLFSFDLDNQKIIIRIKYKDFLHYYQNEDNNFLTKYTIQKSINFKNRLIFKNSQLSEIKVGTPSQKKKTKEINEDKIKDTDNYLKEQDNENEAVSKFNNNLKKNNICISKEENSNIIFKNALSNLNNMNFKLNVNKSLMERKKMTKIIKDIDFNLFEYFGCKICVKKTKLRNIALFDDCNNFYKNQMDVINIFNLLLLLKEELKKDNKQLLKNELNEEIQFNFSQHLRNNI